MNIFFLRLRKKLYLHMMNDHDLIFFYKKYLYLVLRCIFNEIGWKDNIRKKLINLYNCGKLC